MIAGNNLPPGANEDSNAPWHEKQELVEREYDKYEDMDDEEEEYDYEDQV